MATKNPIAKVKTKDIPNLNQSTVEAYKIIKGIVLSNPLMKMFRTKYKIKIAKNQYKYGFLKILFIFIPL